MMARPSFFLGETASNAAPAAVSQDAMLGAFPSGK